MFGTCKVVLAGHLEKSPTASTAMASKDETGLTKITADIGGLSAFVKSMLSPSEDIVNRAVAMCDHLHELATAATDSRLNAIYLDVKAMFDQSYETKEELRELIAKADGADWNSGRFVMIKGTPVTFWHLGQVICDDRGQRCNQYLNVLGQLA
jgi:hypothetical protein